MPRKIPRLLWLALPLAYLLYFYGLSSAGLISPDEPRYASIGREMAHSGDWITPRLWSQPWFEKPALLYWMTGAAFRLGIGPDLAPRLPVALMALAFLGFYWWILNREFGCASATFATLILATCGGWLAYSQTGVTDLPLTATFSAAMMLALPWIGRGDVRYLPAAAALFGLAVLAKGLVPLALALPLLLGGRRVLDWARPRVIAPFLVVALPWYALCYWKNGIAFPKEFFWKQHFERIISGSLMHTQHWWYYVPVLAGLLLPWTALVPLLARRAAYSDPRRLFLLVWLLWGLVMFSIAQNKLPGYVLPLFPAAAGLMALALNETGKAGWWLVCCALSLVAFPIAAAMLPRALAAGITHAPLPPLQAIWLLPIAIAAAVWAFERRGRRAVAVFCVFAGAAAGTVYVKATAAPELERVTSARGLWRQISDRAGDICVENVDRNWRYGLNYYSVTPLPECSQTPRPLRLRQAPGQRPFLE